MVIVGRNIWTRRRGTGYGEQPAHPFLAADVTGKEQLDRMVAEAVRQLGGLHILVNSRSHPVGSATATGPIAAVGRRLPV